MTLCQTPSTIPALFTFAANSGQYLNWFLQDSTTHQPINNSVITATLYQGRSLTDPTDVPGTPVANFTGISLPYLLNTKGQYQGVIPATFDPSPLGTNYVLVVDAVTPGYQPMHWEVAAQVNEGYVRKITTCLLVPVDKFRQDYPEFKDTTVFTESAILYWMAVAALLLNPSRWCDALCLATELYVAHNIVLEAQAVQTALAKGWPGVSKGVIQNENAGQVSIAFDTTIALDEGAGHYSLTIYGTRFYRLTQLFGAGPIQVGPGGYAAGAVPGAYQTTGGEWTGPNTRPSQSSFGG